MHNNNVLCIISKVSLIVTNLQKLTTPQKIPSKEHFSTFKLIVFVVAVHVAILALFHRYYPISNHQMFYREKSNEPILSFLLGNKERDEASSQLVILVLMVGGNRN